MDFQQSNQHALFSCFLSLSLGLCERQLASMSDKLKYQAESTGLPLRQVEKVVALVQSGATIPFMARYRKEQTGGLDEVQLGTFIDSWNRLEEIEKRKQTILKVLEEGNHLTIELRHSIDECWDKNTLEDIYLPFKPKRKTRGEAAIERGLLPLAKQIMAQKSGDLDGLLQRIPAGLSEDEALAGARDIMAEWINERQSLRQSLRNSMAKYAILTSKTKRGVDTSTDEAQTFRDYFEYSEPLRKCPSHRFLALQRGEGRGVLSVSLQLDAETVERAMERYVIRGRGPVADEVRLAAQDAWKRLIHPSISNELLADAKEKADAAAIDVFASNLEPLLLQPPLGEVRTLAIDPGFRTGCKVVCLSENGELLHNETIFPHPPQREWGAAQKKLRTLVESYKIDAISVGNGTAGRETERLVQSVRFDREVRVYIVNEDGASIYSASSIGRAEFPNVDVTVRGAVSIGRRLQDPLAELVKIEPQHIGVGQYQHDVDAKQLNQKLGRVVERCVNSVGVELNTASSALLQHVAGVGPGLSDNIVKYRSEHGGFSSRAELLKVSKLGPKAFEQCAGFIRVSSSKEPLDNTAVHPERYALVRTIAKDARVAVKELIGNREVLEKVDWTQYVSESVGQPTLEDIKKELLSPKRDPRGVAKVLQFADISDIQSLKVGMELPGVVTNLTDFGAFVDIGIKENGLIHISRMADKYIAHPNEVLQVQQHVLVSVEEVDVQRKRIGLRLMEAR